MNNPLQPYDCVLLLSFGGPTGPEEVMPFLERVVAGRRVSRARLEQVALHYQHFGGVSPIVAQSDALKSALSAALARVGPALPVYLGNRFATPTIDEALEEMVRDGHGRAIAIATSAFSSFSGCRAYLLDLGKAEERRRATGEPVPKVHKLPPFGLRPRYAEIWADRILRTLEEGETTRPHLLFTAHSIPESMAEGCAYQDQIHMLIERIVSRLRDHTHTAGFAGHSLAYQSRSGPPSVPWIGPQIEETLPALARDGVDHVLVAPIGFVSDHMEVAWDLDHEARAQAETLGMKFTLAPTPGTHRHFVALLRDLIAEAQAGTPAVKCAPHCCFPRRTASG